MDVKNSEQLIKIDMKINFVGDHMCIFSIIIPVFNTEKYLMECIDSILSQDNEKLEIILIDDGSR